MFLKKYWKLLFIILINGCAIVTFMIRSRAFEGTYRLLPFLCAGLLFILTATVSYHPFIRKKRARGTVLAAALCLFSVVNAAAFFLLQPGVTGAQAEDIASAQFYEASVVSSGTVQGAGGSFLEAGIYRVELKAGTVRHTCYITNSGELL